MTLNKQTMNINFGQGLDKKTDPFQVAPGKFLELKNMVFDVLGRLTKRNGFGLLSALPESVGRYITTYNGNLTAIGDQSLYAYNTSSNSFINKGQLKPAAISTLGLVRNNTNQSYADTAVTQSGLACTVFIDNIPSGSTTTPVYKYTITDSTTGQTILNPAVIDSTGTVGGTVKVRVLGTYFVILYTIKISNNTYLKYARIDTSNPTQALTPVTIDGSGSATSAPTQGIDAVVASNNIMYIVWALSSTDIKYTSLTSAFVLNTIIILPAITAEFVTITADISGSTPVMYVVYIDYNTFNSYIFSFNAGLSIILATTLLTTGTQTLSATVVADSGLATIFYERVSNTAGNLVSSDYIAKQTCTSTGTISSVTTIVRSLGLASKAIIFDDQIYMLTLYASTLQPTYFIINQTGSVVAKVAYQNGPSAYYTQGLSNISVVGTTLLIPYLYKDLVQAVNKSQGVQNVVGIYSQTGVNLLTCELEEVQISSAETASNLNITGGLLYNYDGAQVVENGFNVYPEISLIGSNAASGGNGGQSAQQYSYVVTYEWSDNQGNLYRSAGSIPQFTTVAGTGTAVNFTANYNVNSFVLTTVSILTSLYPGMVLTASFLPLGTYIVSIDSINNTITISNRPTANGTAGAISTTSGGLSTLNIATLRVTDKITNPVKIVIYRWSAAQQIYYQVTSVTNPLLNDPTSDQVTYEDKIGDAGITGNNILYTTGGVVENIGAPAADDVALYKSRLFLISSENKNVIWYSKQVIQNAPVEMSDLFTIYIPPALSGGDASGPTKALYAMDDKLVFFKQNSICYLVGSGPDNTGANNDFTDPVLITASVGCIDKKSILFTPNGLMFQSNKGIWLLGRDLSTTYIGAPVEAYTMASRVKSTSLIPGTNQARFMMDAGITLLYDYYVNQWSVFTNTDSESSTVYNSLHTYITPTGSVRQETPGVYLDNTDPVLVSLTTNWMNLAGLQGFERFYQLYLLGQYKTPFKLNVGIAYDYSDTQNQLVVVTPDRTNPIFEARLFPSKQKCESFQLIINEAYNSAPGIAAGEGLTLSGMNLVIGMKKGYRTSSAGRSFG